MENVFEWIGAICGLLLSLGVAAAGAAGAWKYIDWRLEIRRDLIRYEKARRVGNEVLSASWWLDSADAREALVLLGRQLVENGVIDSSKLRDQWREASSKPKGAANVR